ncbi:hypothetical protein BH10BAC5_BH10BAC5_16480 [soil metagenome]
MSRKRGKMRLNEIFKNKILYIHINYGNRNTQDLYKAIKEKIIY